MKGLEKVIEDSESIRDRISKLRHQSRVSEEYASKAITALLTLESISQAELQNSETLKGENAESK